MNDYSSFANNLYQIYDNYCICHSLLFEDRIEIPVLYSACSWKVLFYVG